MITTMLQGLSMALADSVPGVSGGTVAFILGFYEKFIGAIHGLLGKDPALRKASAFYLLKFAMGWTVGMGSCVLLLSKAFESNIYFLSSLFLGFTAAAIPFIAYEERKSIKGCHTGLLFVLLGAASVIALTWFRSVSGASGNMDFLNLTGLQYGYLFLVGVIAVSAMLLPGISGSTLLLIFGVYVPAVSAVKEVLHFQFQYLSGVVVLAAGALFGIFSAAKVIRKCLRLFRAQMVYLIFGLMTGSLYAIIMGPTTLDAPRAPMDLSSFHIIAFLIGVLVLGGLELIKRKTALGQLDHVET